MAYADFEFYKTIYGGHLTAENFEFSAERASDFMDLLTFNRLKNKSEFEIEVKKCCCELAENIFKNSENNQLKTSETIGSYSVSYKNISDDEINKKNTLIVRKYLLNTGLMYRGVD